MNQDKKNETISQKNEEILVVDVARNFLFSFILLLLITTWAVLSGSYISFLQKLP